MLAPVPPEGIPLLRKVLETWLSSGADEVIVVLGNDAEKVREGLGETQGRPHTPVFVENSRWREGMFSSVKAGLAATDARSTHVALSPADLPFLSENSLRTVLSAAASLDPGGSSLVVPMHGGRRGHPLLVPAALRARVLSWPDSARLNQLFDEPDVTVHCLEGFDESILHDVDIPEDLRARKE